MALGAGDHERRVAEMLRAALGDAVYITCSVDVLPEIREYERTSTTVVNAYIGPVVQTYLSSLVRRLQQAGLRAPVAVMQSNGGIMTAAAAIAKPAYIVESGPAAGVIASARLARLAGHENIISLDMGGTTAKAAMVENGEPAKTSEYEVGAGINLSITHNRCSEVNANAKFHMTPVAMASTSGFGETRSAISPQTQ